ncbi:MAG: 6-bladed beta-propeller [Bacteroidales bacterium]
MNKLFIFIFLVVAACTGPNTTHNTSLNVIDVAGSLNSERVVNISEIADTVEYIPLETTNESVVGKIFNDKVFFERGVFYIALYNGNITMFDEKGEFLISFCRLGRGPEEYDQFYDIDVDHITGNIHVQSFNKINEYSAKGDLITKIKLPGNEELDNLFLFFIKRLPDYYIVASQIYRNTIHSGIVVDTLSNLIIKLDYPKEEIDYVSTLNPKEITVNVNPYIFKYKDKIRVINGNNKYILSINNDLTIDTAYVINYGKLSPHSQPGKFLRPEAPFLWRRFDVFESDNYLFMTFHVGSLVKNPSLLKNPYDNDYVYHHSPSLFNKVTGELTLLSQPEAYKLGFKEDFHDGPPIWPIYVSSDNYLVSIISAMELKHYVSTNEVSRELASIATSLKEESNPVIVRVKLKTQPS